MAEVLSQPVVHELVDLYNCEGNGDVTLLAKALLERERGEMELSRGNGSSSRTIRNSFRLQPSTVYRPSPQSNFSSCYMIHPDPRKFIRALISFERDQAKRSKQDPPTAA
jgi:hypothetical protein